MKQIVSYLVLILFFNVSCNKNDQARQPGPGYFLLTPIQSSGLKSTKVVTEEPSDSELILGDLKASKEFYFILANGGDSPIFDVKLQTNNTQFLISPENISTINGTTDGSSFIPLISLGIIHGIQLNGVGYTSLLPMNENSALLSITGKTLENGDTVNIQSDFNIMVNAKVMDIRFFENGNEIDLMQPRGSVSSNRGGLGFVRYYRVTSEAVTIDNTGNVEITIESSAIDSFGNIIEGDPILLPAGQSADLGLEGRMTIISLNSSGVITNDSRIQLGNDGKGYLGIEKWKE